MAISSVCAAAAAEAAALRKVKKYTDLARYHLFYPLAFETMGPINTAGLDFIRDLGRRISRITDEPRETAYLFQRISVAIQRFNSVAFSNSFDHIDSF